MLNASRILDAGDTPPAGTTSQLDLNHVLYQVPFSGISHEVDSKLPVSLHSSKYQNNCQVLFCLRKQVQLAECCMSQSNVELKALV